MLPGINGVYTMIQKFGSDLGDSIPILGKFGGKLIGTAYGAWYGYKIALDIAKNLVATLPIVGIILFGLLINLKIIIKIFTYHLMAPFVMLLVFTKQNIQIALNYVARVISIMFEIPIFVLSVYAAIAARDILLAIGTPLSAAVLKGLLEIQESQQNNVKIFNGETTQHIGNYIFIGVVEMGLQIFAFVIVYKILTTYHTQIFEAIEAKSASSFDQAIESAKQDAQGWGTKI